MLGYIRQFLGSAKVRILLLLAVFIQWLRTTKYAYRIPANAKAPKKFNQSDNFLFGFALTLLRRLNSTPNLFPTIIKEGFQELRTFYIYFGPTLYPAESIVLTIDEKNVKHILKDNFENYGKGETFHDMWHNVLGRGIFIADGEQWYRQRKTSSKIFTKRKFSGEILDVFNKGTTGLIDKLRIAKDKEEVVDLQVMFFEFTMCAIMEIAFGYSFEKDRERMELFSKCFDAAQLGAFFRIVNPVWRPCVQAADLMEPYFGVEGSIMPLTCANHYDLHSGVLGPVKDSLAHKHFCKIIDEVAYDIIDNRRKEMREGLGQDKNDILSLFMSLGGEDKQSDEDLRDMVMSFIIAGRDTTACTLTWCMYELSRNPEVRRKLDLEVETVVNDDSELTYEVCHEKFPYAEAVIRETIRLHSPVPLDGKFAREDDVLPDGTFIKKSWMVAFCPYGSARDKGYWGEDAEQWNPDRWLSMKSPPSEYVMTSFQAGPRICLGKGKSKPWVLDSCISTLLFALMC